ncbi:MAG: hypothetical protein GVY19_05405 [Bacteroidetes bacterium]|jgi:hypothetical protein|nr:hypothetical protein [Bacteroidota bacterium]
MDHKQQLEQLINQLYDIGEKINEMMTPDKIRAIDVDLLKTKVANLYDDIVWLGREGDSTRYEPPVEQQPTKEHTSDSTPAEKEQEEEAPFELDKTSDQDHKKEQIKEKIIEETKAQLQSKQQEKSSSTDLKSNEEEGRLSLHDELVKKFNKPDLSAKLQSKPIKDLHKAIGLNERYTFINALFDGDVDKYNETISTLNRKSNFNEAFEFVQKQFDWDINSPLVQHLLNLARRKYISHNDA